MAQTLPQPIEQPVEYQSWDPPPTCFQTAKAILPPLIGVLGSIVILYMGYKGYEHEYLRAASTITTITIGSVILLASMTGWIVRHHPHYEIIQKMMGWNVKNTIPYVMIACAFYSYIKNNGDIETYFIWLCMHTSLILLFCLLPFLLRVFDHS